MKQPSKSILNYIEYSLLPVGGTELRLPKVVVTGRKPGGRLYITAGIHGAEYSAVRAAQMLAEDLKNRELRGSVSILPCCNTSAFFEHCRFVIPKDGRNLNRIFPGNPNGTLSERLAYSLLGEVTSSADFHIDMHSGDTSEALIPHVYFMSGNRDSQMLAEASGTRYIVRSGGDKCFYQNSCLRGVPSMLMERGGCGLWNYKESSAYKDEVLNVMGDLGMIMDRKAKSMPVYIGEAAYIDSPVDGCWYPCVSAGQDIQAGDVLGEIRDFFGNLISCITSPIDGVILVLTASLSIKRGDPLVTVGRI